MNPYRDLLRSALFGLSADRSHSLAHAAMRWALPWQKLAAVSHLNIVDPRLETRFAGLEMPNPVGLAAGFDKNAELVGALSTLGFGSICVGSIMPEARYGNPFPRLVRLPETESIADSMGVPSKGRAYAVARLRRPRSGRVPIIANVGGFSSQSIAESILEVQPHVDAVEVSLMCPNFLRPGETFDEVGMLRGILDRIGGRTSSIIVRVPNDTTQTQDRFAELVERCVDANVGGLKVGGGSRIREPKLGTGAGTLHGRAIFDTALVNVERAAGFARGRIPIKGNGGVSSAADVLAMRRAGAVCVDLYSAFVYQGWTVARDINLALLAMFEQAADKDGSMPRSMQLREPERPDLPLMKIQ